MKHISRQSFRAAGLWLLVAASCAGLGACSTSIGDALPVGMGGLSQTAPERPAEAADYPAVHDMPPSRPLATLDEDQKNKLERDLTSARDRQPGRDPVKIKAAEAERVAKRAAAKPRPTETAQQSAGTGPNP